MELRGSVYVKPSEFRVRGWLVPVDRAKDEGVEYPELARLVKSITGDVPRMTAANRSGVSHDTIARLWRGERVSEAMLLRFALGYKTDPNPLFTAAGYEPIFVQAAQKNLETQGTPEIEYIVNLEDLTPEGKNDFDLTKEERAQARRVATQTANETYRTVADALRAVRRKSPGTVPGAGPVRRDDEGE